MQTRICVLASLAAASPFLGLADSASAQYAKVCGITKGAYVAQYKLVIGDKDTGWNDGTAAGAQKCYTAQDAYGTNPVPANVKFTLQAKAKGGTTANCSPTNQAYSSTGGTIKYQADGTTTNVSCQKK